MKFKGKLTLTELGGEYIAVPVGETANNFHGIFRMNESGKMIWEALADGLDLAETAKKLTEVYDIDYNTALKEVEEIVLKLKSVGLIEE